MAFDEFLCVRCKRGQIPNDRKITIKEDQIIMASGICPNCKKNINRTYKIGDLERLRETFAIGEKLCINDSDNPPLDFQIEPDEKQPENGIVTNSENQALNFQKTDNEQSDKNGGQLCMSF